MAVPNGLRGSQLYAAGGYVVSSRLIGGRILDGLIAEAEAVRPVAERNVNLKSDEIRERGGMPARAVRSGSGREWQWAVYGKSALVDRISALCGTQAVPSGRGSYSYYEEPGDFLDLHRDKLVCDVAVITCLQLKDLAGRNASGSLVIYPALAEESLSSVRRRGLAAGTRILLTPGDTIVLLGGIVPHEVTPMMPGQERTVSLMCYRMLSTTSAQRY